jgi:exosortase
MLRAAAFPLGFLLLMIPPPAIVFNRIALPLQLWASEAGAGTLRAAGVPVLREGNVLVLPGVTQQVSEACSGIRSLMSLGTFAILFAYISEDRQFRRVLLALMSVPIAVAVNAFRVALTGLAAAHYGRWAAEGVMHAAAGWAMFVVALILLCALGRLSRRHAPPEPAIALRP